MNSLLHELHLVEYDSMLESLSSLLQEVTFTSEEQSQLLTLKGELSRSIAQECELSLSDEQYESLITLFNLYAENATSAVKEKLVYLSFVMSKL